MIRIVILADTELRARNIAQSLADEERLEVLDARAVVGNQATRVVPADVLVVAGVSADLLPAEGPPVVVLSEEAMEETPFHHGVHAWLNASTPTVDVAAAIIAAASDLTVLTQRQAARWLRGTAQADENSEVITEKLTPREMQVLRMLADGLGNKEIASALKISDHTAKFHVAQILAKLGAASRTEAVTIGIRRGLVPI